MSLHQAMKTGLEALVRSAMEARGVSAHSMRHQRLPSDGSDRVFWRIHFPEQQFSCIAMEYPPLDSTRKRENQAYLKIGTHLHRRGLPVPEIYDYDPNRGWFIVEDLGATNLQAAVSSLPDPLPLYKQTVEKLFDLQTQGAIGFDPRWCCQTQRYDRHVMRRLEADYFRKAFLWRFLGLKEKWPELEEPFDHLADMASGAPQDFFLHRDFQSRNIMVEQGRIGIVDWQGGRLGPSAYDLASLIIDPYADLSASQRYSLYRHYSDLLREHHPTAESSFQRSYPYLALQRNLQILGAFGHLSTTCQKPHFTAYIPAALKTLREELHRNGDHRLLPLRRLVDELSASQKALDICRLG
jgi:hypothetical protein